MSRIINEKQTNVAMRCTDVSQFRVVAGIDPPPEDMVEVKHSPGFKSFEEGPLEKDSKKAKKKQLKTKSSVTVKKMSSVVKKMFLLKKHTKTKSSVTKKVVMTNLIWKKKVSLKSTELNMHQL